MAFFHNNRIKLPPSQVDSLLEYLGYRFFRNLRHSSTGTSQTIQRTYERQEYHLVNEMVQVVGGYHYRGGSNDVDAQLNFLEEWLSPDVIVKIYMRQMLDGNHDTPIEDFHESIYQRYVAKADELRGMPALQRLYGIALSNHNLKIIETILRHVQGNGVSEEAFFAGMNRAVLATAAIVGGDTQEACRLMQDKQMQKCTLNDEQFDLANYVRSLKSVEQWQSFFNLLKMLQELEPIDELLEELQILLMRALQPLGVLPSCLAYEVSKLLLAQFPAVATSWLARIDAWPTQEGMINDFREHVRAEVERQDQVQAMITSMDMCFNQALSC